MSRSTINRLLIGALCVLLLLPAPLWAAVAFVAGAECEGTTGLSCSITPSGSNRALYACVTQAPGGGADVDAVSATFNTSENFTVKFTDTTTNGSRHVRVLRLLSPTATTANVVFTWAGGNHMRAIVGAFSGVDQTTPDDAQQTVDGSGGGTSSTVNVSSATDNLVMDCLTASAGVTVLTAGAGQTEINQMTTDTGAGHQALASSSEAGSTTATMSWSWTGFVSYVGWAWDINAASGGGGATCGGLMLKGVGAC